MKHGLCAHLAAALALLLLVTGQGMALARGMPGPAGQMVICTGSGPVMVALDGTGRPAGPAVICPDAALSLIQATASAPDAVIARARAARLPFRFQSARRHGRTPTAPRARAPPTGG